MANNEYRCAKTSLGQTRRLNIAHFGRKTKLRDGFILFPLAEALHFRNFLPCQAFYEMCESIDWTLSMNRTKLFLLAALVIAATSSTAFGQFRLPGLDQEADKAKPAINVMTNGTGDSFMSRLFDPARWSDHSSYSFQYTSFAGGSVGIGMYTNTLAFQASDDVRFVADVSAVYSPFSSYGSAYSKSLSGIYLSDARLDWKLGDNTTLMIQYIGGPGPNTSPFYYLNNRY
jgi:hypothetical protein